MARLWNVCWLVLGMAYLFVPVIATGIFSLRAKKGEYSLLAYERVLADPRFLTSFGFSLQMALLTIVCCVVIVLPALLVLHLALPQLRPVFEVAAMMPFVIPSIVLVFGYVRAFGTGMFALTTSTLGTYVLLLMGYTVLCLPYVYRALETGLQAIDLRTLVHAARGLGASWLQVVWWVIVPGIKTAVLNGTFLTVAIVIGELTFAQFLLGGTVAFAPFLALLGRARAYEPAAMTVLSLAMTWGVIVILQRLGMRNKDLRPR